MIDDYPDSDSNGIPDAFEKRAPLAELLGFRETEEKPAPVSYDPNYDPNCKCGACADPYYMKSFTPKAPDPPPLIKIAPSCAHLDDLNPRVTCVHLWANKEIKIHNTPTFTGRIPALLCVENHRLSDLLFICQACSQRLVSEQGKRYNEK